MEAIIESGKYKVCQVGTVFCLTEDMFGEDMIIKCFAYYYQAKQELISRLNIDRVYSTKITGEIRYNKKNDSVYVKHKNGIKYEIKKGDWYNIMKVL